MTGRDFFLPISGELLKAMRQASARADERGDVQVIFDGTMRRPWGPYLDADNARMASRWPESTPFRDLLAISDREARQMIRDAQAGASINSIALVHHAHPATVRTIVSRRTTARECAA